MVRFIAVALSAAALLASPAAAQDSADQVVCVYQGLSDEQRSVIAAEWSEAVAAADGRAERLTAASGPALDACAGRYGWNAEQRDAALAYTFDRAALEYRRSQLPPRLSTGAIDQVLMMLPSADSNALSRDGGSELDEAAFNAVIARVAAKLAEAGVAAEDHVTAIRYMVSHNDTMNSMLRLGMLLSEPRR